MMKTIRITYRYSDVEPSLPLILFFRMIGIYVIERFLYPKLDFKKEFAAIGAERVELGWAPYDADLFLLGSEADYDDYEYDMANTLVVINENESILQHRFTNCVVYTEGQSDALIVDVISALQRMRLISGSEADELKRLAAILSENNYFPLVLQCNAMLSKTKTINWNFDSQTIDLNIHSWRSIINLLLNELIESDIDRWGESRGERIQFSIANVSYELDLYCKRMEKELEISPDSLLDVCEYMENFQDDSLQIALMVLKAQIYMDLMGDVTKGYNYLLSICDRCGDYNAYAFFLKGNYWLNNAMDYANAKKYYIYALERYPEYYRAWYRLGVAYYKMGKKSEALMAFEAVTKILKPRLMENNLRVRETEHLFLSYKYCGSIYYGKYEDLRAAISYYKYAEKVYDSVDSSIFYTQMGIDGALLEDIRGNTKALLEIEEVREQLQYWQNLAVLTMGETV